MIHVDPDKRIIMINGVYRFEKVRAAVLEATGRKRMPRDMDQWVMVGLADEEARMISTGLPYQPPNDRVEVEGYIRKKRSTPSQP